MIIIEIQEFIEGEKKKGTTMATLDKYIRDINKFIEFTKLKTDNDLSSLEVETISNIFSMYIESLEKEKYKPTTINGKIIIINKYLKFLGIGCRHNYIKIQKKMYIENVITPGDYIRLLENCKDNKRDEIILKTLANTGLRVSELISLNIHDVYRKEILVKGKGGKYREIILAPQLRELLSTYIDQYRLNTDSEKLFTGIRGALTRTSINKIISKYAKKSHVKKVKAHPHSFRHFFGKRLAERGESLDLIQTYLGHSNISTTAIYTKRSKEELERSLENNFI